MMIGSVYAQQQTTTNVITTTVQSGLPGVQQSWSGFTVTNSTGGGFFGGNVPGYNSSTGQFMFGYNQGTIGYTMAINSALAGSGVQVGGIDYGLTYLNQDFSRGTFTVNASILSNTGITLQSYSHNLPQTTNGWTQWNQTQTFTNPYSLASLGNATLSFTGKDNRWWAGYYGPQFKDPYLKFNYTSEPVDPCINNPLYSPSCPGYQQAYHDQQCSSNPLYAVSCPGYQQAYYTQQCSINPLYDSGCPGYQQAYFNQQCNANPLYNNQCPGYAQAYFDQQCSLNGLYDRSCPNYAQAYAKQQLLNQQNSSTQTASAPVKTTEPEIQVKEDGKVSTDVPLVADPVVNSVLTKNTEAKKEDKKEDKKESSTVEKPKTNAARQAAIAAATKPDPATQTQSEKEFEQTVASQNAAVNAISFVPGFSAYQNAIIPDTNALKMQRQYNKPVTDNARAMRQLNGASDRLHNEMVQQQYR